VTPPAAGINNIAAILLELIFSISLTVGGARFFLGYLF
jgi:hypothetical protein